MTASLGLVEDDETIRRLVTRRLSAADYEVVAFETADAAWKGFLERPLHVWVVDRMVPGRLSGTDLCHLIRAQVPELPILILSALAEPGERIVGLRAGADDYLGKPFEMEELLLRIENLLKRARKRSELRASGFDWDGRSVDFERLEVRVQGKVVALAPRECQLLKLLIEREGRVVTRDEILDQLWGDRTFPTSRTIDNFIVRLRRLLESDPARPKYIHSVRGLGYKFSAT